jgi:YidC/Oxa1 family membrane protein insertase
LIQLTKTQKFFIVIGGLFVLSSCTASFCSNQDISRIMYAYEGGNESLDTNVFIANPGLNAIIEEAETKNFDVPSDNFWLALDEKVFVAAQAEANRNGDGNLSRQETLSRYGYIKFLGPNLTIWGNWDNWVNEIKAGTLVERAETPNKDFTELYKKNVDAVAAQYRSCITTQSGNYGPSGNYFFEGKTWSDAFSRGLIEGLFVYPVAFLIEFFNTTFASSVVGLSQVLAILLTTIVVRGLMILVTFKSTIASQKMTLLQPEIAKLQNKYPNANTNQYERQRLAQEQWAIYKKHGVNPFNQILIAFIQFPVFIAVWGAMTGSAVLATGSFLGLNLSSPLGGVITSRWFQGPWWTALVIFILMTAAQFVAMKLPMWFQKKAQKNVVHTVKSNAAQASASQANMISNVMFVMIIVMGFSLPSAMGIYWFIGALISLAQTLVTRKLIGAKQ